MFVQVSHDASSCKLATTCVRASQPRQLLLSMIVHVSHDNSCWVCSCTLATKWVFAFGCNGSRFYRHRIDFVGQSVHTTLRRRKSGPRHLLWYLSFVLFLRIIRERFLEAVEGTRFLQAVWDMIIQEAQEWLFDTTRGARAILRSYERYEWFLEATREEEKATRWLEKVDNSRAWNAVRPSMVKANCWLKGVWHLVSSCAINVVSTTNDCFDRSRTYVSTSRMGTGLFLCRIKGTVTRRYLQSMQYCSPD